MKQQTLPEEALLLPYERKIMREPWLDYFKAKRQCWLATIQNFPDLWNSFLKLDEIFVREIEDSKSLRDIDQLVPQLLFIKSHQSIRVAVEVGFSTHLTQAFDLTRAAIEAAAIAHKIHREPALGTVFLRKDDGKAELEAFKDAFERKKKENLFPERFPFLVNMHESYKRFSETGTHTTVSSLAQHYRESEDTEYIYKSIAYTGANPRDIATSMYYMIAAFSSIEAAFHDAFSGRLSLDHQLQAMRKKAEAERKAVAKALVEKFGIKGPLILIP